MPHRGFLGNFQTYTDVNSSGHTHGYLIKVVNKIRMPKAYSEGSLYRLYGFITNLVMILSKKLPVCSQIMSVRLC